MLWTPKSILCDFILYKTDAIDSLPTIITTSNLDYLVLIIFIENIVQSYFVKVAQPNGYKVWLGYYFISIGMSLCLLATNDFILKIESNAL